MKSREVKTRLVSLIEPLSLFSASILLLFMIVLPMQYTYIKIILLLFSLIYPVISFLENSLVIDKNSLMWIMGYIFFGLVWTYLGFLNNQEHVLGFFRVYALWPLVILLVLLNFNNQQKFGLMVYLLFFATILIMVINFNSIFRSIGLPFSSVLADIDKSQAIGLHPGYTQINSNSIGSLFFLVPFTFCYSLIEYIEKRRVRFLVLFLFQLILVLISGRRMLLFSLLGISILTVMFVPKIYKVKFNKLSVFTFFVIIISIVISLIFYLNIDLNGLYSRLFFTGENSFGVTYRIRKSIEMISDLNIHEMILGKGGGEIPFEIVYVKLLTEVGIIGMIVFLSLSVYPIIKLASRKFSNSYHTKLSLCIICGYASQLVAMLSNPFESFDYIWVVMLPIFFIIYSEKLERIKDE